MSEIISQFANIFIHYYSNKASSTCKLFISEPSKTKEDVMGRLFGIIEINTPSRENAPIISQLIDDLEDTYYNLSEEGTENIEKSFEAALEKVNQKFSQMIKDKKFYLVGNLNEFTIKEKINLAVGIVKDNKLSLAYLNDIGIYLIHKTKQDYKSIDIRRITETDANSDQKSPNLFSNILQGEINPPDLLFLCNNSFLNFISLERVQKTLTSLPVNKATEYFKNSLLQNEGQNFAAIIIKNLSTQQIEPQISPSITSISELTATESFTERLLSPSFGSIIKKLFNYFIQLINKLKDAFWNLSKNKHFSPKQQALPYSSELAKNKPFHKIFAKKYKPQNNFLFYLGLLIKRPFKKLFHRLPFHGDKWQKFKLFWQLKIIYLKTKLNKIPITSKFLLIIAFIFLGLFIFSTTYFRQQQINKVSSEEFQNIINQITDEKSQAESDIIIGEESKAKDEIIKAQNILASLPIKSQKQKEQYQQLNQEIQAIIAKLRHITTISEPILIADLSSSTENIDIKNIIYLNNQLLAFDFGSNNIYQINLDTRQTDKIASNLSDIGKFIKARKIEDKILIYHDKNGFVSFKDNRLTPYPISLAPNAKLIDFALYNSRLYTLDQANNQIFRHPPADQGFGPGAAWLRENFDLKNINSLAIDTNIWLLDASGQLIKFNKGVKKNFSIKNLEPALEAPSDLFTNDETNFLYILEPKNSRLVVLDKEGNLITQYYSQNFDNPKGFTVAEKEKRMFIINDNKIYFFNLTHL